MAVRVEAGDCREVMPRLAAEGVLFDACVTDPPYHLTSIVKRFGASGAAPAQHGTDGLYARASAGFMGQRWDGGDIAFRPETWRLVFDLLKPGAHLVAFSGTRTYHRMACAIEDAGFEIRDQLAWVYGSGFPKSHDVSKGIDRHQGDARPVIGREILTNDIRGGALLDAVHGGVRPAFEREITSAASAASAAWVGWGTALKPAWEPIVLARVPLCGTVAANVLAHGTGALNIDGCRVEAPEGSVVRMEHRETGSARGYDGGLKGGERIEPQTLGRWPANLGHDGSDEVLAGFPDTASGTGAVKRASGADRDGNRGAALGAESRPAGTVMSCIGDAGSAARFFYTAKADAEDRFGSRHPTVKPVDLMRWLVRLVTPPGGTVLDPFAGSGTTGAAAIAEGFDAILIEREAEYLKDIAERIAWCEGRGRHSTAAKARSKRETKGTLL